MLSNGMSGKVLVATVEKLVLPELKNLIDQGYWAVSFGASIG
jgi:hypothetical protein